MSGYADMNDFLKDCGVRRTKYGYTPVDDASRVREEIAEMVMASRPAIGVAPTERKADAQ